MPDHHSARWRGATDEIAKAVANYVGGALAQALIAAVTSYIVMLILGIPFRGALAVLIGVFDLIPLVGATIAAVLVGIVTVFVGFPATTIAWVIWSIFYQQIENNLIQPRIQSRAVDVQPFLVLVGQCSSAARCSEYSARCWPCPSRPPFRSSSARSCATGASNRRQTPRLKQQPRSRGRQVSARRRPARRSESSRQRPRSVL